MRTSQPSQPHRGARLAAGLALLALVATACAGSGGAAPEAAPVADTTTEATAETSPTAEATKDAVEVPAATEGEGDEARATPTPTPADEPTATEEADPAADDEGAPAPAPAAGDLVDLPSVAAAVSAAIGQPDPGVQAAALGPWDEGITFPDDAVVLALHLQHSDARVLTGDPDAIRPIQTTTAVTALTRQKLDEVAPVYLEQLPELGYELSSSGFSTTTQGDGTEVRTGFFNTGFEGPERANITLTLVARPEGDWVEIELSRTTDADADQAGDPPPIWRWVSDFPAPDGYQQQIAGVRTFYIGRPALSFTATFNGPAGEIDAAMEHVVASLPAGGFELPEGAEVRGDPDNRFLDLAHPGVGTGDVSSSESVGQTALRPRIDLEFTLPESLEAYLLG